MKVEWLNEGQPFPEGHRKAGQLGVVIDFEDGREEPQNVYAADQGAMTLKIAAMYGNTNVRLAEVKAGATRPQPIPPPPAPIDPNAPTAADRRMQLIADLGDPERAPAAILALAKEGGVDLAGQREKEIEQAELVRKTAETTRFVDEHPEWWGTRANAALLRDRTFARVGGNFTAEDLHESYIELQDLGVLQSDQSQKPETPPAPEEPLAPPPAKPRVSTGARPSSLGARPGPLPIGGQPFTEAYILSIAGTEEYARRLRDEPGFQAKVEAVLQ